MKYDDKRIAILMVIHEYGPQQKGLIRNLAKDFDVYIHVDKKACIEVHELQGGRVRAYRQYRVYWGSYNMLLATLFLLKKAAGNGYDRYILVSGSDLPIKSNVEIKRFFENNDKEYLEFVELPKPDWPGNGGFDRIDYFHARALRKKWTFFERIFVEIENRINKRYLTPLMKRLKIKRRLKGVRYFGGAVWMDLSGNCVCQMLNFLRKNRWFLQRFRWTLCADEIFFQTLILNYVKGVHLENRCLRYIDWTGGKSSPKTLTKDDYKKIKRSPNLFARKFDVATDSDIFEMLCNDIGYT